MSKQALDPLDRIPSPDAIRYRLQETEKLAEQLRILLEVSERIEAAKSGGDVLASDAGQPKLLADIFPATDVLVRRLGRINAEADLLRRLIRLSHHRRRDEEELARESK
jgi:hypothetical protein